jgi:hypothetical protein
MADNVTADPGSGGAVLAADDISSVFYPRSKISLGDDGTAVDAVGGAGVVGTNTQRVTLGSDDPAVAKLGTIDTDTGNIATSVSSIDTKQSAIQTAIEAVKTAVEGTLTVTGGGGGTEYTEDAAAAANPVGTALILVREDARAGSLTTTDGDNVALRGNNLGEAYVKATDTDALLSTIDTDTGTIATNSGTIAGDTTSIDGKITACNTGAVVLAAGTAEIGKLAAGVAEIGNVTNSGTFATQATLQAGTAGIGKLTANSGVDIGDVDVLSIIPGTGATNLGKAQDTAGGATDTGVAMLAIRDDEQAAMTPVDGDYTTLRTDKFGNLKVTQLPDATSIVKFGVINHTTSGDNTLQAAAGAGIKIRVLSVSIISTGTVTVRFESGAAGTALTGQYPLIANSGFTLPYNPAGWFETADNTLLNMELSGTIPVHGCFTYVEV